MERFVFPEDFLFGAGISDYQHFGDSDCDLPRIPAARHLEYYEEDFHILRESSLNAFRTGTEWTRIEPEEDRIDEDAVRFYHNYLSRLRETGVKTIVTLHHFTNPRWIHKNSGWLSEETVEKFLDYVDFVSREFDEYIDYYVTINEPTLYAQLAYLADEKDLPPYHRSRREAAHCLENMNEAVKRSYDVIHGRSKKAKVGVAQVANLRVLDPWRNLLKRTLSKMPGHPVIDESIEFWEGNFDYYGINYYCRMLKGRPIAYPEGLRRICNALFKEYKKPILVTENGLANRDDDQRTAFLILHLKNLFDTMNRDGTKILGYCWWSFLHGYEWGLGYKPFFALIDVDIDDSCKRVPTETAHEYSKVAKSRGFTSSVYEECQRLEISLGFEDWP